jgi:hypothetical protein
VAKSSLPSRSINSATAADGCVEGASPARRVAQHQVIAIATDKIPRIDLKIIRTISLPKSLIAAVMEQG